MNKFNVKFYLAVLMLVMCSGHVFGADIVDTMSHATSFKIFSTALKSSGLAEKLKHSGPYTVFAPSDDALLKLPKGQWDALTKDKVRLADIVAHHVAIGKIIVAEAKPGDVATLDGKPLHLQSDNGMVSVDEAKVTQSDILADNGVIHEIDALVLPEDQK